MNEKIEAAEGNVVTDTTLLFQSDLLMRIHLGKRRPRAAALPPAPSTGDARVWRATTTTTKVKHTHTHTHTAPRKTQQLLKFSVKCKNILRIFKVCFPSTQLFITMLGCSTV